jgi:hypothetical protein
MIRTVIIALVGAIIIIALALAARAQAYLPPIEFDRPYQGRLIIHEEQTMEDLKDQCGKTALACAKSGDGWCYIFKLPNELLRALGYNPDHIMRHEHGHCHRPKWLDHEGSRVPSKADDARWNRLYDARVLYQDRRASDVKIPSATVDRSGKAPSGELSLPDGAR